MPAFQKTNYLAITIALIVAGLICVFAAFHIDARIQKVAMAEAGEKKVERELRILRHVDAELGVGRLVYASHKITQDDVEVEANELLEEIESPETIEKLANDEVSDAVAAISADLSKLVAFWISNTSTTTYDSLTASGDFYLISSDVLRKNLTELKVAQGRLRLLEDIHISFVDTELRPLLSELDSMSDGDYVKSRKKAKIANLLRRLVEQITTLKDGDKSLNAIVEKIGIKEAIAELEKNTIRNVPKEGETPSGDDEDEKRDSTNE